MMYLYIRTCASSRNRHLTVKYQVIRIVPPLSELGPYYSESKDHKHSPGPTISEQPETRGAHSQARTNSEPNPPPNENATKYPRGNMLESNGISFRSPSSHASLFGEIASVTYRHAVSRNAGSQKDLPLCPGAEKKSLFFYTGHSTQLHIRDAPVTWMFS